jgi:quinol monooxygenase YgiN
MQQNESKCFAAQMIVHHAGTSTEGSHVTKVAKRGGSHGKTQNDSGSAMKDNERFHVDNTPQYTKMVPKSNEDLGSDSLVAMTTGQYKPGQENPGFLTLVLNAIQTIRTYARCVTQEVHVHAPFPEGSSLVTVDNCRNFMVYTKWKDEASYLKSKHAFANMKPQVPRIIVVCNTLIESGPTSDFDDLDGEMPDAARSQGIISESSMHIQKTNNCTKQVQTDVLIPDRGLDCFETVDTELWKRIKIVKAAHADSKKAAPAQETRTCSAYAVMLKVKCPIKDSAACSRMLCACSKLALDGEGCLSFDIHIKYDALKSGASIKIGGDSSSYRQLSEFMMYAVFATQQDFAFHMQQHHCVFCREKQAHAESVQNVATFDESFWRRADFPTARKAS